MSIEHLNTMWKSGLSTGLTIGIIIGIFIGFIIGRITEPAVTIKSLTKEQLELRIKFMDMYREYLEDAMRWYDEAVEWNKRAREEGEKVRLKQGEKE